jgi:hypothetical protein
MKTLFFTLLLAALCAATSYGQTIKALGYNTTNGQVVYTGTNNLNFISDVGFQLIESARLDIKDGTNTVVLLDDGAAEFLVSTSFLHPDGVFFTTNSAASTLANLGLGTNASVTISNLNAQSVNISNVTNFRTAIGLGATNDVQFNEVLVSSIRDGSTNIVLDAENYVLYSGTTTNIIADFGGTNFQMRAPISFSTNTFAATTMRALAGSTNTNEPFSGLLEVVDVGIYNDTIQITISNGIIVRVEQ